MTDPRRPPLLLTPGPLTTSDGVRAALGRDWGSRNDDFIALTARVRSGLVDLLPEHDGLTAVPIQGSGSFAVEAMLGCFVGRDDHLLILVNGAYGRRMAEMARTLGLRHTLFETAETEPPDPARLDAVLAADPSIGVVAVVHCETTTGILNPLDAITAVVAARGRELLVDAMSSFGALPIGGGVRFAALAASSNKCLQGVPGIAFVVARGDALAATAGRARSVVLDLHAQWRGFEATGQWRFTPPVQVVAGLAEALDELAAEGGPAAREARYRANLAVLTAGLARVGLPTLLPAALQAPIIVTVPAPTAAWYDFTALHARLAERGFVLYPGKLTGIDSFRIGCIGDVHPADLEAFVAVLAEVIADLSAAVPSPSPSRPEDRP